MTEQPSSTPHAPPTFEDDDRIRIYSRTEIIFTLRTIMQRGELVHIYLANGHETIVTSILAIDGERDAVVFDYGIAEEINQRALQASRLIVNSALDKVKIHFICNKLTKIAFADRPAFRSQVPETLVRIQRREYFRCPTPISKPIKCLIPLPAGSPAGRMEVTVVNISCGGLGVMDCNDNHYLEEGATYSNCKLMLPESETIQISIKICSSTEITLKNGKKGHRIGCQFINMGHDTSAKIQRYIMKLERQQRDRLG